jgi:hypothetical protein
VRLQLWQGRRNYDNNTTNCSGQWSNSHHSIPYLQQERVYPFCEGLLL